MKDFLTLGRYLPAKPVLLVLLVLLPLSLFISIASGAVSIPLADVVAALVSADSDNQTHSIITRLRLPRALLAAFIGALLGVSGALTQGLFRNPLADPSLIGVTGGAVLGASLAIVFGGSVLATSAGLPVVAVGAFLGGGFAVLLVYRLATTAMGTSVTTMLLAGIAITALAGSASSLLEFVANNEMLRRISLWRMGGLDGATFSGVAFAAVLCAAILVMLPRYASALNVMLLGESEARHLGVNVAVLKRTLVCIVALAVGASVALAGAISFLGLVVPHIVRLLIGPDHRFLLPASALAGGVLLLWADTFARIVIAPTELPVGLVTAAIGAPFFIFLLRRGNAHAW